MKDITLTTRIILLTLLGAMPLMITKTYTAGFLFFAVYNIIVFLVIWLDIHLTLKPDEIEGERLCATKLSISEKNKISIVLKNRSRQDVRIHIQDEFPEEFEVEKKDFEIILKGRSKCVVEYDVIPHRRGDYSFGNIIVSYHGILECVERHLIIDCREWIKVYPNIMNISKFELMMRRSHLIESGLITERRRGEGTEFESLKEYTIDDEFRKIDWKATARHHKLISREYQAESNQSIIIAVDFSRPMGVKINHYTTLDYSVNAALLLGYLVNKRDDKIGLISFSNMVNSYLPPKRGKRQYHQFLENLYNLEPERVEPDYEELFTFIINSKIRRSLIVILTDLSSGEAATRIKECCGLISRKHLPVVVSVMNPDLIKYSRKTPGSLEDTYRKIVADDILNKMKKAQATIENMGFITLFLPPEKISSSILANYLTQKSRSRL